MSEIRVGIRNGQFTLNGKATQLRMRTSFKWLGYLWQDNVPLAERWLERIKDQGFHGIRVLGEHHHWDGPFYGLYPLIKPYNLRGHGKIVAKHQQVLRLAISLLRKHDAIMEYVVIATIKGPSGDDPRKEEDIVGFNAKAMRNIANFFFEAGATNILPELINECGAHIAGEMRLPNGKVVPTKKGGKLSNKYLIELGNEARRWREDWPGSPVGISQGAWDFQYAVGPSAFTHVNIHSPRHGDWERIGGEIDELKRRFPQYPIYLNENIHYMSEAQWNHWTPIIPKWRNMSTTDAARIRSQWNTAYLHGASYCVHDITGQATNPDWDWTPLEHMHKEQFNPDPPPPPPPPPPPDPPSKGFWQKLWDFLKSLFGID